MKKIAIPINHKNNQLTISGYLQEKGKEWILCLHGLQSNKELFDSIFKNKAFKGYSILAIDLVGFGGSTKPKGFTYDIQDQAEVVKKLSEKLQLKKVHIIGHSLGGMVGTLLIKSLGSIITSFINLEGNLVFEDCGLSREISQMPYSKFKDNAFDKIKLSLKRSKEKSARLRKKWIDQIPDYAFYKTSKSIVKWSKSKKI